MDMGTELELQPLYSYRVHTTGGHIHLVCVPFKELSAFWDHIKELSSEDSILDTFAISMQNNSVVEVGILASTVTSIDAPFGKDTVVLSEVNERIVAERTRNAVKKARAKSERLKEAAYPRKNAKKRTL